MFRGVFTSPKASDVDSHLTVEHFNSLCWYDLAKDFAEQNKSPRITGRVKTKTQSVKHMIFPQMNHGMISYQQPF